MSENQPHICNSHLEAIQRLSESAAFLGRFSWYNFGPGCRLKKKRLYKATLFALFSFSLCSILLKKSLLFEVFLFNYALELFPAILSGNNEGVLNQSATAPKSC